MVTTKVKSGKQPKAELLETIDGKDALAILRVLITSNKELKKQVEEIAKKLLTNISIDNICDEVYSALDLLDVHDVWDNSGGCSDGYHDPGDIAWEMFEIELESFWVEMKKCQELGMYDAAIMHCIGILLGINKFATDSTSEFVDWAVDAPTTYFDETFDKWKQGCKSFAKEKEKMDQIVKKHYPDLQEILAKMMC